MRSSEPDEAEPDRNPVGFSPRRCGACRYAITAAGRSRRRLVTWRGAGTGATVPNGTERLIELVRDLPNVRELRLIRRSIEDEVRRKGRLREVGAHACDPRDVRRDAVEERVEVFLTDL